MQYIERFNICLQKCRPTNIIVCIGVLFIFIFFIYNYTMKKKKKNLLH